MLCFSPALPIFKHPLLANRDLLHGCGGWFLLYPYQRASMYSDVQKTAWTQLRHFKQFFMPVFSSPLRGAGVHSSHNLDLQQSVHGIHVLTTNTTIMQVSGGKSCISILSIWRNILCLYILISASLKYDVLNISTLK